MQVLQVIDRQNQSLQNQQILIQLMFGKIPEGCLLCISAEGQFHSSHRLRSEMELASAALKNITISCSVTGTASCVTWLSLMY